MKEKLIFGTDEAGRGPVVGPLVIAGVLASEKEIEKLKEIEVKDSKLLTHKKREKLAAEIKKIVKDYKIIVIEPKEIDEAVDGVNSNLNRLEAVKTAQMINALKPDEVILDCPSPNTVSYVDYLKVFLKNKDVKIIAEHKADVKYPIVSAASILAKVVREEEVEKIEKKIGKCIGTGYSSNPICQKFTKENWDKHPEIFRKSWSTWQNHKNNHSQKKLGEF